MEVPVKNMQGQVVGQIELDERVFGIAPHRAVVHQAVVAQQANARRGTHDTKTRGEVAGGGRKPWRQKGTGRARQGSTRAPHWRGGGIAFGPHPRSYEQRLPKRMRRLAMRSALSDKVAQDELVVLDAFSLETAKTKDMLGALAALEIADSALIVLSDRNNSVIRASANLPKVRAVTPDGLNLQDVLQCRRLLITRDAVEIVSERLTREVRRRPAVEPAASGTE